MPSNLPPGCGSTDPDLQCEVCGKFVDDCICPECPVCHVFGDARCYLQHGLQCTPEQIASKINADEAQRQAIQDENDYYDSVIKPGMDADFEAWKKENP